MKDKTKVLKTYRILSFIWGIERACYNYRARRMQSSLLELHSPCTMIQPALAKSETSVTYSLHPQHPVPSKQWVQSLHFGKPMALTSVSSLLKRNVVRPKRLRISSTMRVYCGESVVA